MPKSESEDKAEVVTYLEQKKELTKQLLENCSYTGWQQRPWTFLQVTFVTDEPETSVYELGFSKVSKTDVWDPQEGIKIACEKAAARVAKLMLLPKDRLDKIYPPIELGVPITGTYNNLVKGD